MGLKEKYREEIVPLMKKEFSYKNNLEVPTLEKVVINQGIGDGAGDAKLLEKAIDELTIITGQKPLKTLSKKSIAGFKLREGQPVGAKVTLRGQRMYDFLEKVIHVVLPKIRDFKGILSKSFDGRGNYNLGIKEQILFPEINYDKVDRIRGMDVTIVTSAKTDKEAKFLLEKLGMPFRKEGEN